MNIARFSLIDAPASLSVPTAVVNGAATVLEDVSFTFQKIEVRDQGTGAVAVDDWEAPQT